MFVGHYMGGVMYGVTPLMMGPPILGRVPYVQNSLSDKVSVAGRGRSKLKASGLRPTKKQVEEALKRNGCPRKWSRWPCKGNQPRAQFLENGRPFQLSEMLLDAAVLLKVLIVGACADLLRNDQHRGPGLT